MNLESIFGSAGNGTQPSSEDADKAKKKAKLFSVSPLGFDYVSNDMETDTITAVGLLDIVAGSKGKDTITATGYYAWIDGKDGDDTIDAKQTVGAWIEGGKGNDTIHGPMLSAELGGLGSVIFGDELSAVSPLNPVPNINYGPDFKFGKSIKYSASVSLLEMTGAGNDTIHTGTGLLNIVFGGDGNDIIYGEGYVNILFGDEIDLKAGFDIEYDLTPAALASGNNEPKFNLQLPGLNGSGNDTIYGTRNSIDVVVGGHGNDTIQGLAPNVADGSVNVDVLFGNDGMDTIKGGTGLNVISGGDDADDITGGDFANFIFGDGYELAFGLPLSNLETLKEFELTTAFGLLPTGSGKDTIVGGDGLDFIVGGAEADQITAKNGLNVVLGDALNLAVGNTIDLQKVLDDPDMATEVFFPFTFEGEFDDTITGGNSIDAVFGGGGDDHIETYEGLIDVIFGNDGDDTIAAGPGFNVVVGGDGADSILGGHDGNLIWGDGFTGVDGEYINRVPIGSSDVRERKIVGKVGFIPAGSGVDTITGGNGLDVIFGGESSDVIMAGDGFNFVLGDTFHVSINRTIDLSSIRSTILSLANPLTYLSVEFHFAGSGDDRVTGGSGTNVFMGGDGNDVLIGGSADDYLFGNGNNDWICGHAGQDVLGGGDGADTLCGGAGEDALWGGDGIDILDGGPDDDALHGGDANDLFYFTDFAAESTWSLFDIYSWANDFDQAFDTGFTGAAGVCLTPPAPLLFAPQRSARPSSGSDRTRLTMQTLLGIATSADSRWLQVLPDMHSDLLERTEFVIDDLPGMQLGTAASSGGGDFVVTIDVDAAGYSWFVDSTPDDDTEFSTSTGASTLFAAVPGPAVQGVDLLTVVMHEFGHVLGLADLHGEAHETRIMADSLSLAERKLPRADDVAFDAVEAGTGDVVHTLHVNPPTTVVNGNFDFDDPADIGFGWDTIGNAAIENGTGILTEHDQFNSRFSQTIGIPAQATGLTFIVQPDLASPGGGVPDAFEFALIDAHTGQSVFPVAVGMPNTDALLNVQPGGATYYSPSISSAGLGASGDAFDYSQPRTFTVDLTGLTEDIAATLYFDLLGFGEMDSTVSIFNVQLDGMFPPALSMALDENSDSGIAGDNLTATNPVNLGGATDAGQIVLLDIDGDGFDDGSTTADATGFYMFENVTLPEGTTTVRTQATNSQGSAEQSLDITIDSQAPDGSLASPLAGTVVNVDSGFVDVQWTDPGDALLDETTFDVNDLTITGVTIDSAQNLGGGLVRYVYNDDGDQLPQGTIDVARQPGEVADTAGNANAAATESFVRDSLTPVGQLNNPAADSTTSTDSGYVEIHWGDRGVAGLDESTFDPNDITIAGVSVDRIENLGGGRVRYFYDDDGDTLSGGLITVTRLVNAVSDLAGNMSEQGSDVFTYEVPTPTSVESVSFYNQDVDSERSFSQDGTGQRSIIRRISVVFNGEVDVPTGEVTDNGFTLTNTDSAASVGLNVESATAADGKTEVVLSFQPSTLIEPTGSLVDGNYRLVIDGNVLGVDANSDGSPGGTRSIDFHRLFGDSDGDRDVDRRDRTNYMLAVRGTLAAESVFDYDGDGVLMTTPTTTDDDDLDTFFGQLGKKLYLD